MQAIPRFFLGAASLAAAVLSALSGARAAGTDTDAFPVFDNYLLLSGQGVRVSGDSAAFQARNWTSRSGYGGIEDFRYSKDLSNDFTLQLDGHALGITSDYLAHLNLAKSEVGSVDAGYERFRTFYDGVGGFFPLNNQWFALSYSNLHVDRSKFWVETTIALPHKPVITLKYTNELRAGTKDSTIWADTDFTGLPTGQTISQVRKIAPAYRQLGERHQTLEGTIKQTVGNTTIELRLLGDKVNNDDTLQPEQPGAFLLRRGDRGEDTFRRGQDRDDPQPFPHVSHGSQLPVPEQRFHRQPAALHKHADRRRPRRGYDLQLPRPARRLPRKDLHRQCRARLETVQGLLDPGRPARRGSLHEQRGLVLLGGTGQRQHNRDRGSGAEFDLLAGQG
jgi:hypothetical protein